MRFLQLTFVCVCSAILGALLSLRLVSHSGNFPEWLVGPGAHRLSQQINAPVDLQPGVFRLFSDDGEPRMFLYVRKGRAGMATGISMGVSVDGEESLLPFLSLAVTENGPALIFSTEESSCMLTSSELVFSEGSEPRGEDVITLRVGPGR